MKYIIDLALLPFMMWRELIISIIKYYQREKEIKIAEKEWINNSYEYDGGRYNKEYFDLVDGIPVAKWGKQ